LKAGDPLGVEVDVTNRSQRAGDEVVEVYLNFPKVSGAPLRALRGFERVHLPAGASRRVHLDLGARDLSMVNESGDRIIAAGDYGISVGGGQPGTGAPSVEAKFTVHGQQNLPEWQ
jgi:beta-glucosidase